MAIVTIDVRRVLELVAALRHDQVRHAHVCGGVEGRSQKCAPTSLRVQLGNARVICFQEDGLDDDVKIAPGHLVLHTLNAMHLLVPFVDELVKDEI